jgi:hypothetical protein
MGVATVRRLPISQHPGLFRETVIVVDPTANGVPRCRVDFLRDKMRSYTSAYMCLVPASRWGLHEVLHLGYIGSCYVESDWCVDFDIMVFVSAAPETSVILAHLGTFDSPLGSMNSCSQAGQHVELRAKSKHWLTLPDLLDGIDSLLSFSFHYSRCWKAAVCIEKPRNDLVAISTLETRFAARQENVPAASIVAGLPQRTWASIFRV